MELSTIDIVIICSFFALSLIIGAVVAKKSGSSSKEFFLSGRNMPWWLLGVSMVATTFSADTPNLVADIVRKNGVAGNWVWWAFLLTGMLTVFVYAKLWRRSEVVTDLEFYEIRYSGKPAAFLRKFRAIYLGVFFNVMVMATVMLAAIKIGSIMLGLEPWLIVLVTGSVTVVYSSMGGLRGVLITDFILFIIAMIGSVWAAILVVDLPQVGGMTQLMNSPLIADKIDFIPDFENTELLIQLLIIPLAVQWWSVWYPGAEPGGGGYIAQRMLSAKNENHAVGATLFFNIAHYALRPWPWIVIALASLVVFPELTDIQEAFPLVSEDVIDDDLAYPAMLTFLPTGVLGLVIASLVSAVMSTLSTQLNWGSSYIVNDFYLRFINEDASEKQLVTVGRLSTLLLMIFASLLALVLGSALNAFDILLQIGAGTGLIFILRWFWWRINAWSEISAMFASFAFVLIFEFVFPKVGIEALDSMLFPGAQLVTGIVLTTIVWVMVTLMTDPTDESKLKSFYELIGPGGPGWKELRDKFPDMSKHGTDWKVPMQILMMMVACAMVYSFLFSFGYIIYGQSATGLPLMAFAVVLGVVLQRLWVKVEGA